MPNKFTRDWSKVPEEHHPKRIHATVEVDGEFFECSGHVRPLWPMGEKIPRTWESPAYLLQTTECSEKPITVWARSLDKAKKRVIRAIRTRRIYRQNKGKE
jgi:hypothetical protein